MALGDISQFAVAKEDSFGSLSAGATYKIIKLTENTMKKTKLWEDPGEITGDRTKADNINTGAESGGDFSIVLAPENGTAQMMLFGAGSVTTYGGAFHRADTTLTAGATLIQFTDRDGGALANLVSGSEELVIDGVLQTITTDYTMDYALAQATLVTPATGGEVVDMAAVETVAGVYSHVFESSNDQDSFELQDYKGQVRIFKHTGCKVNSLSMEFAESFFSAAINVLGKDVIPLSAGSSFPAGSLSTLNPFIKKQAQARIDRLDVTYVEGFTFEINNNLEGKNALACDDTVSRVTPGTQEVPVSFDYEFDSDTYSVWEMYENETFHQLELVIGECNGVEIASTGVNYSFQIFVPRFREEEADAPTVTGPLNATASGFANFDSSRGYSYQIVMVNAESDLTP